MIAIDTSVVENEGEEPVNIWWQGKQWAVTEYGIEARDGTYHIEASRLLTQFDEHSWIEQLANKNWTDIDDFATAFMVAIVLHGRSEVDRDALLMKLDKAKRRAKR